MSKSYKHIVFYFFECYRLKGKSHLNCEAASVCEGYRPQKDACAGIFKQSMGAKNRVGIGFLYWPTKLHSLAEFVP